MDRFKRILMYVFYLHYACYVMYHVVRRFHLPIMLVMDLALHLRLGGCMSDGRAISRQLAADKESSKC